MTNFEPVDYVVLGHLTRDITPTGWKLGGTAAYSALTAARLGFKVGIVTAGNFSLPIQELEGIPVSLALDEKSSTFENIQTEHGRIQFLHQKAPEIHFESIPESWKSPAIIHLGPIMQEVPINILDHFTKGLICLTPQGWLRTIDQNHQVVPCAWEEDEQALHQAEVTILSNEDVRYNEDIVKRYVNLAKVLVVTEGFAGSRVYFNGSYEYFHAPEQPQVDPTGAGDIFSACFFCKYLQCGDPWISAAFATAIAARSVTREGLMGVPDAEEIEIYDIKVGKDI